MAAPEAAASTATPTSVLPLAVVVIFFAALSQYTAASCEMAPVALGSVQMPVNA